MVKPIYVFFLSPHYIANLHTSKSMCAKNVASPDGGFRGAVFTVCTVGFEQQTSVIEANALFIRPVTTCLMILWKKKVLRCNLYNKNKQFWFKCYESMIFVKEVHDVLVISSRTPVRLHLFWRLYILRPSSKFNIIIFMNIYFMQNEKVDN